MASQCWGALRFYGESMVIHKNLLYYFFYRGFVSIRTQEWMKYGGWDNRVDTLEQTSGHEMTWWVLCILYETGESNAVLGYCLPDTAMKCYKLLEFRVFYHLAPPDLTTWFLWPLLSACSMWNILPSPQQPSTLPGPQPGHLQGSDQTPALPRDLSFQLLC